MDTPDLTTNDSVPTAPELWIPFATHLPKSGHTVGTYPKGYPEGLVIHTTDGNPHQKGEDGIDFQLESAMLYLFMDKDGGIFQNFPLDHYGSHAGHSHWEGIGDAVSRHLLGIEVACAGLLSPDGSPDWNRGHPLPVDEIREFTHDHANIYHGKYNRMTDAQEESMDALITWLYHNNPDVFNLDFVLGHDEVATPHGRKTDPGGSLSVTMPEYREHLKQLIL